MESREDKSLSQNHGNIFFLDFTPFISLLDFFIFIKINDFLSKIGPIRALWAHMGPNRNKFLLNFDRACMFLLGPYHAGLNSSLSELWADLSHYRNLMCLRRSAQQSVRSPRATFLPQNLKYYYCWRALRPIWVLIGPLWAHICAHVETISGYLWLRPLGPSGYLWLGPLLTFGPGWGP